MRFIMISCTVLICIASAGIVTGQSSGPDPDKAALQLAGTFDINKNFRAQGGTSKMFVRQLVARQKHLYFVLSTDPTAQNCVLVRTDFSGGIEQKIPLGADFTRDVAVDENLNVFVLSEPRDGETALTTYNSQGRLIANIPVPSRTVRVVAVGNEVFTLSYDGDARSINKSAPPVRYRQGANITNLYLEALPNHELASIDSVEADLQIAALDKGTVRIVPLWTPEINQIKTNYQQTIKNPLLKGVTVLGVAGDEKGALYLMLSGFKAHTPMKIVKIDSDGTTKAALNALLPPRRNEPGLMIPIGLAITAGQVFVVDQTGIVAIFYMGW
jgi:hypothetical protein